MAMWCRALSGSGLYQLVQRRWYRVIFPFPPVSLRDQIVRASVVVGVAGSPMGASGQVFSMSLCILPKYKAFVWEGTVQLHISPTNGHHNEIETVLRKLSIGPETKFPPQIY